MDRVLNTPTTLQEAVIHYADFENCKAFMVSLRWPDGKVLCPRCGSEDVAYLPNARVFKCYLKHERQKFSLKVGTIFEDSPLGLEKWLPVMWLLVNCKKGVSSWEIHRAIGVTQKTAWFMLQRARLAMQDGKTGGMLGGEVEVDETFIGGKARNMHADKRAHKITGRGPEGKAIVAAVLERGGKGMESFWSLLKRGINGTYVSIEPFHLFRYVDEQAFQFTNRVEMNDSDRFVAVMKQIVGKRLTYEQLIGKTGEPETETL